MEIKYYKVKRTVKGLLTKGSLFICWDGQRFYHAKSNTNSSYLDAAIFNKYGGIDKYFQTVAPFDFPLFKELTENSENEIRQMQIEIAAKEKRIAALTEFIKLARNQAAVPESK